MPSALTAGDYTSLRGDNHQIDIFCSVLKPRVLWTAQVNDGSIAREETVIAWDNGSGLEYNWLERYQTVWVGTAPGLHDVGRVRIKTVSSGDGGVTGTLTVGANALDWSNNNHLTFLHNYELWSIFPRIDNNEVFYKDDDVTYTDQNEEIIPVCIAGPNQAGFMSAGSIVFNLPVNAESYAVTPGTSINTAATTVTVRPTTGASVGAPVGGVYPITITQAGQYWVRCRVEDSNGNQSRQRQVCLFAHSADKSSPNYPAIVSSMTLSGDWDNGGWEAGVNVVGPASFTDYPDNSLVVIWQRARYQGVAKNISILDYGKNILISGYLSRDQIAWDKAAGGNVDFEVITIEAMLRNRFMFSISLASDNNPNKWYEYRNNALTAGRILHHIYSEHSTLLTVADFIGLTDNGTLRKYADLETGTLYEMGDTLAREHGINAHIVCAKNGRMRLVRDIALLSDSARAAATVFAEWDDPDIVAPVTIVHNPIKRVSFVFYSGLNYNGTDVTPIGSTAPGTKPDPEGSSHVQLERQMVPSQAVSNQIAGQVFAKENNPYPEVRITFKGNYLGVLEPNVSGWSEIDVASGDTTRGIIWTDQKLACRNVRAQFDISAGVITVDASFETEVDGTDGVPYKWPTIPPIPGGQEPPIDDGQPGSEVQALLTGDGSIHYLPGNVSTWNLRTTNAVNHLGLDLYWPAKQNSESPLDAIIWRCNEGSIQRSTDAAQTWTTMTPGDPPNDAGDSPAPTLAASSIVEHHGNYFVDQEHVFIVRWQNAGGNWRSWLLITQNDGTSWTWQSVLEAGCKPVLNAENDHTNTHETNNGSAIVSLTTTKVAAAYIDATNDLTVVIGTVSGTSISWGTPVSQSSGALGLRVNGRSLARLDDSQFAIVYESQDDGSCDSNGWQSAVVVTVVGTTPTFGTHYDNIGLCAATNRMVAGPLTAQKFLMADKDDLGGDTGRVRVGVVSGTGASATIAFGSWVSIGSGTATTMDLELLDTGFEEFVVSNGDYVRNGSVASVNVISWDGPAVEIDAANLDLGGGTIARHSRTKFTIVYGWRDQGGASPPRELRARIGTISGGNISLTQAFTNPYVTSNKAITVTATGMTSDKFACTFSLEDEAVVRVTAGRSFADTVSWCVDAQQASTQTNKIIGADKLTDTTFVVHYEDAAVTPNLTALIADIGATNEIKLLGGSISNGSGANFLVTGWAGATEELFLQTYSLPSLALVNDVSLGATTEAELNAKTYIARPLCPLIGTDDDVVLYGRMNDPLGSGPVHILYSADLGISALLMVGDWGTDHCSAATWDSFGLMFFVRKSGASSKLYSGFPAATPQLLSTIAFNAGVNPWAIVVDWDDNVIVGADTSVAEYIIFTPPPYVVWYDITGNHTTATGLKALLAI